MIKILSYTKTGSVVTLNVDFHGVQRTETFDIEEAFKEPSEHDRQQILFIFRDGVYFKSGRDGLMDWDQAKTDSSNEKDGLIVAEDVNGID